jgi:hypothetical protein
MTESYQPYSRSNSGYNPFNAFYYYTHRFKQQPLVFKLNNILVDETIVQKLEKKKAEKIFDSKMDYRSKKNDKRDIFTTQIYYVYKDALVCLDCTKDDDDDYIPSTANNETFEEKMQNKSFWVQILYTDIASLEEIRGMFEYKENIKTT